MTSATTAKTATGVILLTLASAQFLMTLDSSVMNVSIATVAKDVGTTVTGIQTAITLYTLVMASLMITGGKIGQILGRKRAFAIGCVIYGCGSFTTAIAPNLAVLMIGLVVARGHRRGADHAGDRRAGRVELRPDRAAAGLRPGRVGRRDRGRRRAAHRRALHDLRVVALGVRRRGARGGVILALARRMADTPAEPGATLDLVGTALSAVGLGLIVFGVLRSGTWGFVRPKPERARVARPVAGDLADARRGCRAVGVPRLGAAAVSTAGEAALIDPAILRNRCSAAGSPRSSSSTCCRPACSSRSRCSCRSRSGCRRSPPACACSRCRSRCCSRRSASRSSSRRVPAPGRAARLPRAVRGHRRHDRAARRRRRARDRHLADAARRARRRRAGVAARQRDRVGGPRRAERRGRRAPEHVHQPRRVDRHRARRRGAHLRAHRVVPRRASPTTPTCSKELAVEGARSSSRAGSRSSPTPTSSTRSTTPGSRARPRTPIVDENEEARLDGLRARSPSSRSSPCSQSSSRAASPPANRAPPWKRSTAADPSPPTSCSRPVSLLNRSKRSTRRRHAPYGRGTRPVAARR